jgi:hypothetical protein
MLFGGAGAAAAALPSCNAVAYVQLVNGTEICNTVCIILEIEGPMVVIAAPDRSQAFEDGSFGHTRGIGPTSSISAADHKGVRVTYHKVEHSAVSTTQPRHWKTCLGFENDLDAEVAASQHSCRALKAALYQQEEPVTTETEGEATSNVMLKDEIVRLKKLLSQQQGSGQATSNGAGGVARQTRTVPKVTSKAKERYFDPDGEDDEAESEESDSEDAADPLLMSLKALQASGVQSQSAASTGGRPMSSPPAASPPAAAADMNVLIQLELVRALRKLTKKGSDNSSGGGDGGDLDGLKVVKALSHMRASKSLFLKRPMKMVREYSEEWEERLGARGKPWTWQTDVARHIAWGKYRWMLRVFCMLGAIKEHLERKEHDLAEARAVQCMKAIHQFSLDGSWRVSWPLTHLPDPVERPKKGATEAELEAVLGYLRVHDDIKKRTKGLSTMAEVVSEDEHEEGADRPGKGGGRGKPKAKAAAA